MSNEELHHDHSNPPETPREDEIRTLLVRLLELVAVRIADKLQHRSSAERRENSPKRSSPDSDGWSRGR